MGSGELFKHLAIWPGVALIVFILVPFLFSYLRSKFSKDE